MWFHTLSIQYSVPFWKILVKFPALVRRHYYQNRHKATLRTLYSGKLKKNCPRPKKVVPGNQTTYYFTDCFYLETEKKQIVFQHNLYTLNAISVLKQCYNLCSINHISEINNNIDSGKHPEAQIKYLRQMSKYDSYITAIFYHDYWSYFNISESILRISIGYLTQQTCMALCFVHLSFNNFDTQCSFINEWKC